MEFAVIACVDNKNGIGKDGTIPWDSPSDRKFFSLVTTGTGYADKYNVVLMGRKTYESLPARFKPLPNRINIILSRSINGIQIMNAKTENSTVSQKQSSNGFINASSTQLPIVYVNSLTSALEWVSANETICEKLFICGGQDIYEEALLHPLCRTVYLNHITGDYKCDRLFPVHLLNQFLPHQSEYQQMTRLNCYVRVNLPELAYLDIMRKLLYAPVKLNRTDVFTRSIFVETLRFPLTVNNQKILPLLTTKFVSIKSIIHELVWMLSGVPNTDYLRENNVKIWDANTSAEFLSKNGLKYREGETGPIYGFQWRHWNAKYNNSSEYRNSIDQIANLISEIKTNPFSRRLLVTAWNPEQLNEMCLPPCHFVFQVNVEPDESVEMKPKYISMHVNMRSADFALGVPFNIAFYSILTHMIGMVCNLTPRELILTMGDCHLYTNHEEGARKQITREPRGFPKLHFAKQSYQSIDEFKFSDITISGYAPYPVIKYPFTA